MNINAKQALAFVIIDESIHEMCEELFSMHKKLIFHIVYRFCFDKPRDFNFFITQLTIFSALDSLKQVTKKKTTTIHKNINKEKQRKNINNV